MNNVSTKRTCILLFFGFILLLAVIVLCILYGKMNGVFLGFIIWEILILYTIMQYSFIIHDIFIEDGKTILINLFFKKEILDLKIIDVELPRSYHFYIITNKRNYTINYTKRNYNCIIEYMEKTSVDKQTIDSLMTKVRRNFFSFRD